MSAHMWASLPRGPDCGRYCLSGSLGLPGAALAVEQHGGSGLRGAQLLGVGRVGPGAVASVVEAAAHVVEHVALLHQLLDAPGGICVVHAWLDDCATYVPTIHSR